LLRGLQERVLMMRQTTFLVQAFNVSNGARLKPKETPSTLRII
jgi:hypothetical protein